MEEQQLLRPAGRPEVSYLVSSIVTVLRRLWDYEQAEDDFDDLKSIQPFQEDYMDRFKEWRNYMKEHCEIATRFETEEEECWRHIEELIERQPSVPSSVLAKEVRTAHAIRQRNHELSEELDAEQKEFYEHDERFRRQDGEHRQKCNASKEKMDSFDYLLVRDTLDLVLEWNRNRLNIIRGSV